MFTWRERKSAFPRNVAPTSGPRISRVTHHELAVPDGERHAHPIEIERLANNPLLTLGSVGTTIILDLQHFGHDRVAENSEPLDPEKARLLGGTSPIEIDVEPHAPTDQARIKIDQPECLACVVRHGDKPP